MSVNEAIIDLELAKAEGTGSVEYIVDFTYFYNFLDNSKAIYYNNLSQ